MMPMLDTRAAEANAVAFKEVGKAIQSMGRDGMEIAGRIQAMDDAKKESDLFIAFNEQASQFANSLLTRQDVDEWIPEWKGQIEAFQQQANEAGLSPAAKARMSIRLAEWATARSIEFEKTAALRKIEAAKGSMMLLGSHSAARGDRAGVEQAKALAREAGLQQHELDAFSLQLERELNKHDISESIMENPMEAEKDLRDPNWLDRNPWATKADQARLLEMAREVQQGNRAAEIDTIKQALDAGVLQQRDIESATWLTPLDRKQLTLALQKTDPPSSEIHSQAWDILFKQREAFADPKVSDEEYAKMWNDNRTKIQSLVPSKYQGDINSELHYRSPANRKAVRTNPPGYTDEREIVTLGYQKINRALKGGVFGNIGAEASRAERESAYDKEARLRFQYRQMISTLRDISLPEAQKIAEELISGDVSASAPPLTTPLFDYAEGMVLPPMNSDELDAFTPNDLDSFLNGD